MCKAIILKTKQTDTNSKARKSSGPDRSTHTATWQCVSATQGTRDVPGEKKLTHTRKQLTPHNEVEKQCMRRHQCVRRDRKKSTGEDTWHPTRGNPKDGMQHSRKEREDLEKEETELSEKDF